MEPHSENVFTKFIAITPHAGLSGLGFVGFFFLIEEVIAPSPSRVSDRAAVDHRGVMGSSAAACPRSPSSTGTSASRLCANTG